MLTCGKPVSQAALDFAYEPLVDISDWPPEYAEDEDIPVDRDVDGLMHGPVCPHLGALIYERKGANEVTQVGKCFCGEAHITLCKGLMASAR
jgi:hypothetical protein